MVSVGVRKRAVPGQLPNNIFHLMIGCILNFGSTIFLRNRGQLSSTPIGVLLYKSTQSLQRDSTFIKHCVTYLKQEVSVNSTKVSRRYIIKCR
jgi:hypothetical protein